MPIRTINEALEWRAKLKSVTDVLDDSAAVNAVELFDLWNANRQYSTGNRVRYNGLLYRCLTSHTSQADWTPDAAPSLWVRIDDPAIEFPEWRQPQGAHDAYSVGAKVSHNGSRWVSSVDANIWEPGVYGWDKVVS